MTNLAEHWDGSWLNDGWHDVTVKEVRTFAATSGTEGVEFMCIDTNGNKGKATFWLSEPALGMLASWARACGMTKDACRSYNPDNPNSHRVLIGKRVRVEVVPDDNDDSGKYHRIDGWEPIGAVAPEASTRTTTTTSPQEPTTPAGATPAAGMDIPF